MAVCVPVQTSYQATTRVKTKDVDGIQGPGSWQQNPRQVCDTCILAVDGTHCIYNKSIYTAHFWFVSNACTVFL
jgi:hypothetical protein